MMNKIKSAVKTSNDISNNQFIICARTDAFSVLGIDETINRSKRYIDAGASMIFPEGLKSIEDFTYVSE